jgi:hypothetical protein
MECKTIERMSLNNRHPEIDLPDLYQAVETGLDLSEILEAKEAAAEEYANQRIGKFTASDCYKLMTHENQIDKLPAGAETHVLEKVGEILTNSCSFSDDWTNAAMQWGKDHEVEAVERFVKEQNKEVKRYGGNQKFYQYEGDQKILAGHVGGTPDGDVDELTGLEVKCPNTTTHLKYLMGVVDAETLKKVEAKYYWQIHMYFLLTGKRAWYFMSYDPRIVNEAKQAHIVKIERNETDILRLITRLEMAVNRKVELLNELGYKIAA